MARLATFVVLYIVIVSTASSKKLPHYATKCKGSDSDCLKESVQKIIDTMATKGEPDLDLGKIGAVKIPDFSTRVIANTTNVAVTGKHVVIKGFETAHVQEIKLTDAELKIKFHMGYITSKGDYELNGEMLHLPLEGKGILTVHFEDFDAEYVAKIYKDTKNSNTYYRVQNDDSAVLHFSYPKGGKITFENFFDGDVKVEKEANQYYNEHLMDTFKEIESEYAKVMCHSVVNPYINGFFRNIAVADLIV